MYCNDVKVRDDVIPSISQQRDAAGTSETETMEIRKSQWDLSRTKYHPTGSLSRLSRSMSLNCLCFIWCTTIWIETKTVQNHYVEGKLSTSVVQLRFGMLFCRKNWHCSPKSHGTWVGLYDKKQETTIAHDVTQPRKWSIYKKILCTRLWVVLSSQLTEMICLMW
jgi:hypothetical protein